MNTASTWRRIFAYGIDSTILAFCLLPFWIQVWVSTMLDESITIDWQWLAGALLLQLFYKWSFLYLLGGTMGKLIMGLRVVPSDQSETELGLFQSFLRVATDGLSFFFGVAPRALLLLRLDRTHISDWVAETRVVQLAPQTQLMRRHWMLALFVIWIAFFSQFQNIYRTFQDLEFEDGQIVVVR